METASDGDLVVIIVGSYDRSDRVREAHRVASAVGMAVLTVSPLLHSSWRGRDCECFMIAPTGLDDSVDALPLASEARAQFLEWARGQGHLVVVEVRFDDRARSAIHHSFTTLPRR